MGSGTSGLVGAALIRRLQQEHCEVLTVGRESVNLTRQEDVERWMMEVCPQAIFIADAKVGGILANSTYPADFIYENLMTAANIIHAAAT